MRSWLMAVAVAAAVAVPAWAAELVTLRETEAGFTVQLPGKAETTRKPGGGTGDSQFQKVEYKLEGAEGSYLIVGVKFGRDLSEDTLTRALDSTITAGVTAEGNRETSRRTMRLSGVQAREAEFVNGSLRGWVRVFYRNGWLCTMIVTQREGLSMETPPRALASFQPL